VPNDPTSSKHGSSWLYFCCGRAREVILALLFDLRAVQMTPDGGG
jgi:hypothetical protein